MFIINAEGFEEIEVGRQHICYNAKPDPLNPDAHLLEVIEEVWYKHPDAPEHASISRIETRNILSVEHSRTQQVGPLLLLDHVENTLKNIYPHSRFRPSDRKSHE